MKKLLKNWVTFILVSTLLLSCKKDNNMPVDATENTSANMVLQWNNAGVLAVASTGILFFFLHESKSVDTSIKATQFFSNFFISSVFINDFKN